MKSHTRHKLRTYDWLSFHILFLLHLKRERTGENFSLTSHEFSYIQIKFLNIMACAVTSNNDSLLVVMEEDEKS